MAKKGKGTAEGKKASRRIEEFSPPQWNQPKWWDVPHNPDLMTPVNIRSPRVDMLDLGDAIYIEVELPGVSRSKLGLSAAENVLTIRAVAEPKEEGAREHYYREIHRGEFQRTLLLPCAVDWEKTTARMREGMLAMECPKIAQQEGAVRSRTIQVE